MKVTILGSAQDAGVPQLFCTCPNCVAATDSGLRRTASSILVSAPEGDWLLDVSPDLRAQLVREPVGLAVTHAHAGHLMGLALLGKEGPQLQVPLVVTPTMAKFLRANEPLASVIAGMDVVELDAGDSWGPLRFWPINHRAEWSDTVAIEVRGEHRLVYLPDTDRWDGAVDDVASSLQEHDVLLFDATFYGDELQHRDMSDIPHPPVRDVLPQLRGLVERGVRVVLTHFNHTNPLLDPESQAANEVNAAGVELAYDGMTISV